MEGFKFKPGDEIRLLNGYDWHRRIEALVVTADGRLYDTSAFYHPDGQPQPSRIAAEYTDAKYELVPQPPRFKEGDLLTLGGSGMYWLVLAPTASCLRLAAADKYGNPTGPEYDTNPDDFDFVKVEPKPKKVMVELVGPTGNVETTVEKNHPLPLIHCVLLPNPEPPRRARYILDGDRYVFDSVK